LENSGYKEVYDAYLQGYDAGYEQDEIVRRMLDSPNRTIAVLTAQFSIQKHKLTVQDLEKSLTAKVSWLANYVPKTMYTYIIKRDEKKIKDLRKSLVGLSGEETLLVLTKIKTIQEEQNKLKKKILEKNE
jgi:transcription elongation factor GreA-like protein